MFANFQNPFAFGVFLEVEDDGELGVLIVVDDLVGGVDSIFEVVDFE